MRYLGRGVNFPVALEGAPKLKAILERAEEFPQVSNMWWGNQHALSLRRGMTRRRGW